MEQKLGWVVGGHSGESLLLGSVRSSMMSVLLVCGGLGVAGNRRDARGRLARLLELAGEGSLREGKWWCDDFWRSLGMALPLRRIKD
jgi:hypothetical protein